MYPLPTPTVRWNLRNLLNLLNFQASTWFLPSRAFHLRPSFHLNWWPDPVGPKHSKHATLHSTAPALNLDLPSSSRAALNDKQLRSRLSSSSVLFYIFFLLHIFRIDFSSYIRILPCATPSFSVDVRWIFSYCGFFDYCFPFHRIEVFLSKQPGQL